MSVIINGTSGISTDGGSELFGSGSIGGSLTLTSGTANGVTYLNGSKVLTSGSALTFDGSNLGLGVTPSAWNSAFKTEQVFNSHIASTGNDVFVGSNAFYNSGGSWRYIASATASQYYQDAGSHVWRTAPSGTAGNAISFTQAMTLDASGNLLVGKTSAGIANNGFEARADGLTQITRAGGIVASLNRKTSDGAILEFNKDGTAVGAISSVGGVDIAIGSGNVGLRFQQSAPISLRPTSSAGSTQDGIISLGNSGARFFDLYLSGGVYVGGTGSANHLDDYEEGTWTPIDSSGAGLTFSATSAKYVKIGRQVTAWATVAYPSTADASNARIGGLPFTIGPNQCDRSGGMIGYKTDSTLTTILGEDNNTYVVPRNNVGAAISNATLSGDTIYWAITYGT